MKKIKIMHIIDDMNDGGAQRIILNYLRDLKNDEDVEIKLFVYGFKNNSYVNRIIEKEHLNVCYLNTKNTKINIPYFRKFFNQQIAYHVWYKAIKEYQPDIIHVHISPLLFNCLNAISKYDALIRFDTLHSHPSRFKGIELRYIKRAFQKEKFIPICVTNEQAQLAKKYYGFNKYEVVYNGIDIENIKSKIVSKENARNLYNISLNTFVIIGVGRLDKIKRFDLLIDIFKKILEKKENSILIIAGNGREKSNLINKAKSLNILDKVRFIGNQDNIIPLYCASDVLVITSKSESASLVLLEGQVCNLRCVISSGVPSESIVTKNVKKMNTNATIDDWSTSILDCNYVGKKINDLSSYDVHDISKKMKGIYLKYWREYNNE